ncbi:hypothetical protein I6A84_33435 [Frankia sp. CNm7]|uniref:DUF4388 domain-containing protein n=1 Tax=Frankia nepalensis TaxID=1836974 RepID=A0A937RCF1_9ACTN|nr:hypothetical protein [Frankia nepalensis]MBL7502615.1 hypothetical protein [Frankia nepalensis]MBL7514793.1 hypothetical protein [Frankia nepalensis]MBL7522860.1 hypothetical protein [Frankia nepalensis]MBL7629556.1 hypothetical protein [Frankia nepalensis]
MGADSAADGYVLLDVLSRLGEERFSGTLRAEGARVRGTVVLSSGLLIAADTPVAPGVESLLVGSGRISREDWTDAFNRASPAGRMRAELVERGLFGDAAAQVVTQTAAMDAVFALALADVFACVPDPVKADPLMPLVPGMDVGRVVRETRRRLVVAAEWHELGLRARAQPRATSAAPPIDEGRAEILARVNGRRTAGDLAFLLGRGLFAVMSDMALLCRDGQIAFDQSQPATASALSWFGDPDDMSLVAPGPLEAEARDLRAHAGSADSAPRHRPISRRGGRGAR